MHLLIFFLDGFHLTFIEKTKDEIFKQNAHILILQYKSKQLHTMN